MAKMRTYGDPCKTAQALDLVGERWALLVVRELLLGPKRFTDLQKGLRNASPDVLAQRLRELEEAGVLRHRKLGPPAGTSVYELTDWGQELETVVMELGRWGSRSPFAPDGFDMSVDSQVIALKADFDGDRADDLSASYELRFGDDTFHVEIADGEIEVGRGSADDPVATIQTDQVTLASVIWGGRSISDAERAGDMKVEGSKPALKRFLGLFPLPQPV